MFSSKTFSTIQYLSIICQHTNRFSSSSSLSMNLGLAMKKLIDAKQYQNVLKIYDENCKISNDFMIDMTLRACIKLKDYQRIEAIEKNLSKESLNNSYVQTSLIQFYIQRGNIDKALNVFSTIEKKSNYLYTIIFKDLIAHNKANKVLDLYQEMKIKPNDYTLTVIFDSCAQLVNERAMVIGKKLLDQILKKRSTNNIMLTSAINMLMNFGEVKDAEQIFEKIKEKDSIAYGTMMKGYNINNQPLKTLQLFQQMKKENIKPDEIKFLLLINACSQIGILSICQQIVDQIPSHFFNNRKISTSLIDMWGKVGSIKNAQQTFELIKNRDLISYNTMIKSYRLNLMGLRAIELYETMSFTPDDVTYSAIMDTCTQLNNDQAKTIGKKIIDQILKKRSTNNIMLTSAINMLMNFGEVKDAEQIFEKIKEKDSIAYGTMMKGYNMNNQPLKTLQLFQQMKKENINPDEIIFVLLINTYAQIGILSLCHKIVNEIPSHFSNNIQISNSLIDMWGKVSSVKNAQGIFESIKNPDVITYNTMINSFGLNLMGLEAVKLYETIPNNIRDEISHICVLNACSHSGLLHQAYQIFNQISNKTEKITTTMIDCLSRLFLFDEAQKLLDEYEKTNSASLIMYMTILSGARNHRNSSLSEKLYDKIKILFPNEKDHIISGSILLCNVYTSLGDSQRAQDIRSNRINKFGKKVKPGLAWTEFNGEIVEFRAHDQSHPRSKEIYEEAKKISSELIAYGYEYDSTWITRPLGEDETVESVLCGHSERLAIAFNFVVRSNPSMIQITKNLRVCGDCHEATKLIAKIRKCEIIVRDANCIHHFHTNGQCSCQDHF